MDRDVRAIELQNQNAGAWLRSSVNAFEMNSIFTSTSLFAENMTMPYSEIKLDPFVKIGFPLTKEVRDLVKLKSKLSLFHLEQKVSCHV